ncbi:thioredoxin family protein [Burkholderiaceae bacterium FT117]|uniref:thioredoxin family protein n=1 Tax=Zeimonas sediminis TaxID=2944268 RepID=UPI002342F04E|nr:thioredoxin family protein [Zeimonas sediminis]MCM5569563.1 thioredoxin family protein [Zeimonas sediminis]
MPPLAKTASALALALWAACAAALDIVPFSAEALQQARQAEAPIALHFHSKSCATCRLQEKAFVAMRDDPELDMKLLVVDFDEDTETPRSFRVFSTGAVVVLRGSAERARMMGVVDRKQLKAGLLKAF